MEFSYVIWLLIGAVGIAALWRIIVLSRSVSALQSQLKNARSDVSHWMEECEDHKGSESERNVLLHSRLTAKEDELGQAKALLSVAESQRDEAQAKLKKSQPKEKKSERRDYSALVPQYLTQHPGSSQRAVAKALGCSPNTAKAHWPSEPEPEPQLQLNAVGAGAD